ncbi:HTTM domain-containing protein [Cellulophaga lytica]|nr:HTTM domain-containing protein [Cellulophaga lytica]
MTTFLFKKIDNAGLILFRIFFGILISLESFGAILTGWVKANLVEPTFNFSFIGFEWLNTITGPGMYAYFVIMGITGIFISVGYKYRYSMLTFALLWTSVYLMQKTSYNNHYYLLMLISWIMVFFPANADNSIDARKNPEIRTNKMYAYNKYIIVLQLTIVYTYASVAKLYADWLDFGFIKVLMQNKANYFLIGEFLQLAWVHKVVAVFGILFDLLIIPALLWKPSRKIAFVLAIFFHLFNSIVFQIGIFPYLALAFTVFFFEPQKLRKIFYMVEKKALPITTTTPKYKNLVVSIWIIYFLFQLVLPVRHHFFKDDVLWTEEGHRLSWRMMLRSRSGSVTFTTVDKDTNEKKRINLSNYLTKKQRRKIGAYPDFIWQFAQHLKKEAKKENKNIAVYVNSRVSVNGKPYQPFIDPKVDLAQEKWHHFKHNNFILPSPK